MPLRLKPSDGPETLAPFTFSPSPEPSPPTSPSQAIPPSVWMPERDMKAFGAYPLGDIGGMELGRGVVRCGKCSRVGLESAVADHAKICDHLLLGTPLTAKKASKAKLDEEGSSRKRRASDVSMSPVSPTKKRSKHLPPPPQPGMSSKKENKKEAKERQRLERKEMKEREKAEIAERKRMRTNGPLNLDRQCGVINDKGLPCMRSLTCKTHTVGSKRAVEGRTRPYDELYIEWQRINNPNFKEPAPRKDKAAREEEKRQKNRGEEARKKVKKPKSIGASVETLGADEDESEEMEALLRATRYAGRKVHSTARARLGGNTVTAFPAVIPRREMQYPPQSAPADANPAACLAIWQSGRQDQLRVGQLLASALATRKANSASAVDEKRTPLFGKGLGVQLNSVQVQS